MEKPVFQQLIGAINQAADPKKVTAGFVEVWPRRMDIESFEDLESCLKRELDGVSNCQVARINMTEIGDTLYLELKLYYTRLEGEEDPKPLRYTMISTIKWA